MAYKKFIPKDANQELVRDTARMTKESTALVKDIALSYTKFIAKIIKEGIFETVAVPYFGKFGPKVREIRYRQTKKGIVPLVGNNDET